MKARTEEELCWLCWLRAHSNSSKGLASWLSGVEHFLAANVLPRLPRGALYRNNIRTISAIYDPASTPSPAPAVAESVLVHVRQRLDLRLPQHAALWCACVFAFQGLLRVSEYAAGRMLRRDLQIRSDRLVITVPFSKTTPTPQEVALVRRGDILCPVVAFRALSRFLPGGENTPLFTFSPDSFNANLARLVTSVGGPAHVTSHSLRRGGCTALFVAGVPEFLIKMHGRWRSDKWKSYIDFDGLQQHVPTAALLLRSFHLANHLQQP